jgi:putative ABC transport system permease protein
MARLSWLETVAQDSRFGARLLWRTPGFTVAALLTLALGIGANTAIFSVVHAVLLAPLPYANPDRLVMFGDRNRAGDASNIGYATWQDYRDRSRSFEQVAVVRSWAPTLVVGGEAERVSAMRVSWNYFDMLGVRPVLGRGFGPEEDAGERWRVLLISDGLWRRRFGADPGIIGRSVRMNDRDFQVIGVLPAAYQPLVSEHFYQRADIWAPLGYDTTMPYACRSCQHLRAMGRLRPGVSLEQAAADLTAIRADLLRQFPGDYARGVVQVTRFDDAFAGPVRGILFTLLGAVAFVLLIACANVANLLLARGLRRRREIAVRSALGAGRGRLLQQLVIESLVLAGAGGLLGIGLAALAIDALGTVAPVSVLRLDRAALDAPVLLFAIGTTFVTGLIAGVMPAARAAAASSISFGRDSRVDVGGHDRARRLLVVADLALAFVLLAGATLMVKSVVHLLRVDPGFDPRGVLSMQYSLVGSAYAKDPAVHAFTSQLVSRTASLPGVESAAAAGQIPMGGNGDSWGFHIEGRGAANPAEDLSVERYSVTPDYFRVMRIPLESGRLFTDADAADSLPVIVLAHSAARALFPNENPVGRRVRIGDPNDGPWRTIIGIVGDVRHTGLDIPPTPQMYTPQSQQTDSFLVLTVRSAGGFEDLVAAIRRIVHELDPAVPTFEIASLDDLVARTTAGHRFVLNLLGIFAALAVLLAAVGLYGVIAFTVSRRTREVGVRMALGARPGDVLRLIVGSGAVTVATGLAAGVAGALLLARFLESQLFGVSPHDPAALAVSAGLLASVAVAAHWFPTRRAMRVDPAVALRDL